VRTEPTVTLRTRLSLVCRRCARLPFLLAALLLPTACTDASLYQGQGDTASPDRVALTGTVCAEDTFAAELPLRVVIVGDQAIGPLFASFDPGADRIRVLASFVQSALALPDTSVAVVGFGGRSTKLAPVEPCMPMPGQSCNFSTNPGELVNAINQLSLAQPCLPGGDCRDYVEGLRTARALIEGDLAETAAGDRIVTQYVVLLVVAGPQDPMAENIDCCAPDDAACLGAPPVPDPDCQSQRELAEVAAMKSAIENGGALGLKLHVVHLAADGDPAVNDRVQSAMEQMAFSGAGLYQRFNTPASLSPASLDLLRVRTTLRIKTLFVANANARPTPQGPQVDSDGDGLSDFEEELLGTLPGTVDSDRDGIGDMVESLVDFDPLSPDMPTACVRVNPALDSDLDGLSDCDEALLGTEPTLVDTDGDGMPDLLEVIAHTDYLHRDSEADADGDGITNADEVRARTDPRSTDARSQLSYGYRYDLEDLGVVVEKFALPLTQLTGVEVIDTTEGTSAGVGTLIWSASMGTLRWQDALDGMPGPAADIAAGGEHDLPSSSYAPVQGEDGRLIRVRVMPADLPPGDVIERVRIVFRERHCLDYTVRNIRLMETQMLDDGTGPGLNRIVLYFAQTPQGRLSSPGPYRLAEIPVYYIPPRREPNAAVLQVLDEEFVRPR